MVTALFRRAGPVFSTLEKSLVFLTGDNIGAVLAGEGFLQSVWEIANVIWTALAPRCSGRVRSGSSA